MELIAARNGVLPQFDVGASYRWYGIGDQLINADRNGINFPQVGSTAFDELTEGRFQEAALFMSMQTPVGYRAELAEVRRSELELARAKAHLEDQELAASHLLGSALRSLDLQHALAQTHYNRWHSAQSELDSNRALIEQGSGTVDLLLDSQRRLAQARFAYYQAICEYNKQIALVHYRKGSLLDYDNIVLTEGTWPRKAYWDAVERARARGASHFLDYGYMRPSVISRGPAVQQVEDISPVRQDGEPRSRLQTQPAAPAAEPQDDEGVDAPQATS
jgi:hypothetical protein